MAVASVEATAVVAKTMYSQPTSLLFERKLDSVNSGICDSTFALNNTINGNFRTLDNAICNIGYQALQTPMQFSHSWLTVAAVSRARLKTLLTATRKNSWTISKQISLTVAATLKK